VPPVAQELSAPAPDEMPILGARGWLQWVIVRLEDSDPRCKRPGRCPLSLTVKECMGCIGTG
jgi:hypothetical protein